MSTPLFLLSYATLWTMMGILAYAVLVLYRIHGRILVADEARNLELGPKPDSKVKLFRLESQTGDQVRLGEPVLPLQLIVLFASKCQHCMEALPDFGRFATKSPGIESIAVVAGFPSDGELGQFQRHLPKSVPVVINNDFGVSRAWRVNRFPYGIVVDSQRRLRGKAPIDNADSFDDLVAQVGAAKSRSASVGAKT